MNSAANNKHAFPLLLFLVLSLVMTYPLVLNMTNHVPSDLGDPLFITWILAWSSHKLDTGLADFWDANIFYPHRKTLLYADHVIGLSLLAAPIAALTGNVLLSFNVLYILSFFLCALGMYALVIHLTRSRHAAVISGLVFAFFPYRFAHISHLEILFFGWTAFFFLFLHRFFENPSIRNCVGIGVFFVLQVLCCGYYGIYLVLFAALFVLFFAVKTGYFLRGYFWTRGSLTAAVCFVILIPLYYPYLAVHAKLGFSRSLREITHFSAQIQHFLSVPPWNVFLGGPLGTEGAQEWQLYPGLILLVLVVAGFVLREGPYAGIRETGKGEKIYYGLMAAVALILSFGPVIRVLDRKLITGPYMFLYRWVPGFGSLRVPSRISVLTMLALAVLGGYGVARLMGRFPPTKIRSAVSSFIGALILLEYLSIPLPLAKIEPIGQMPKIYSTVKKLPPGTPLLELPFPSSGVGRALDAIYMYFSTSHWMPIVNGYCGFDPPGYVIIRDAMEDFPSQETLDLLRNLRVFHVIIHTDGFRQEWAKETLKRVDRFRSQIHLIDEQEGKYLFRLLPARAGSSAPKSRVPGTKLWKLSSNSNGARAARAADGDLDTGWCTSHPYAEGDYFQIDLLGKQRVGRIELHMNGKPLSYPRGFIIEGSLDGKGWMKIGERTNAFPFLTPQNIEDYSRYRLDIDVMPSDVRYLRITLTRSHGLRRWWIHEIVLRR